MILSFGERSLVEVLNAFTVFEVMSKERLQELEDLKMHLNQALV
jgi:hypothetical protein